MKFLLKIFLLFILFTPKYSIAQKNTCSDFTRQQIIDSIKVHPEMKFLLKYPCFDKLSFKDIKNIYGSDEFSCSIIKKYNSYNTIQNSLKLITIPAIILTIFSFGSIDKTQGFDANYQKLFNGISLIPIDIIGIVIIASFGDSKKKLYKNLISTH